MKLFTSDFIFSLIEKYQVPLQTSRPAEFSDDSYLQFCKEYCQFSALRDINLIAHLTSTPNLFRTFLPWRNGIFGTLFQIHWYYDEIIIYDPILFEINHFDRDSIEDSKRNLVKIVSFLYQLKESIQQGFVLFGGYETFKTNSIPDNSSLTKLLSKPEVREECDRLVQVFKMESEEGSRKEYYNVRCYYKDQQKMFTVYKDVEKLKTQGGYELSFDFTGSKYTPLTLENVKQEALYERVYNGYEPYYSEEIKEVLNYIGVSSKIKAPVLFNRKLDEIILSNVALQDNSNKSKVNDFYKLLLPFVDGIPSERLLDVRMNMPEAFLDFRNHMFEIIQDFEKGSTEPEILKLKLEQKVNPILRKLDAEIDNSITKASINGLVAPIVSGVGALGLWHLGVDPTKYLGLIAGGASVAAELKIISEFMTERRISKTNSMYYLWKVRKTTVKGSK